MNYPHHKGCELATAYLSKIIRKIRTGLHTQQYCYIIEGVFGQLSDGMWENSRAAEGYWPFIDAELENMLTYQL